MQKNNIKTVTELTREIKGVLELGFSNIMVQGELSNFKLHSSGHAYFTLKDDGAQISCVLWRNRVQQLLFKPTDGMKVIARGSVSVYEPRGNYQLDCIHLQPMGIGELQLAFERLKQKLKAEGLFDPDFKKPIPLYPARIGVVTSPTGAAVQDIVSVLTRRMPAVEVVLVPVKVQGIGAAEEIVSAIEALNQFRNVDVIIVGRGGGSLEDLWAFNEEIVARSIFKSEIPIISAVGHEIDFSISDFVADLRAPTPSAAAELAVKDKNELIELIGNICYTMSATMAHGIDSQRQSIEHLIQSYSFNKPQDLLRQKSQRTDDMIHRLENSTLNNLQSNHHRYNLLSGRITILDPSLTLKRGYAIVKQDGKFIPSASLIQVKHDAVIEFHDGRMQAAVEKKEVFTHGKKRD
ncbi:MAG: exodeoxyribonuclease VII large subunit [Bacteroidota bacterium]